jgi:glycosyltransferase involved in cell wall biosynthesis
VTYYPPVATDEFRPDPDRRARARKELGVLDGAPLIGTVSNLNPQKGIEYLVRAAALVHQDFPDLFIRVFGAYTPTHDRYAAQLRDEARERGLLEGARLAFVDPGTRVPELLPALDVFLFTSVPRSEGVPTAVLEAMACGLPVVATDVGGIREAVEDGVTGSIVPPLNPTTIARATLRLLHDPELRARMGSEARRRAVERFDVEECAQTHVRAFEVALAHHATGAALPSDHLNSSRAEPRLNDHE